VHAPGPGAASVRAARGFAIATLDQWGAGERRDDVATVLTELLTNALRHARPGTGAGAPGPPIRLGLLHPGCCVLCAVTDPSLAAPVPRPAGTLAETGRGLHIVGALSDRWGYTALHSTGLHSTGKVVWAVFARRPA